ncbi:hypothetical protein SLH46_01490 [Draconibacterium sp. IB214405]|uniref:hypothetical protein n=1 Tax=Draconibacterium sp. IB214405 TaxID=3097352 RepID=UPI002A1395EC|nr:hypothetical protein [Draconibacterium sp. IB214405]MDX8337835.1 hypothetical protein [Draconibacterium sp. IB214405]
MFTVGIFTTHFPYVVFIVFYAYFLLFGVEQAHDGKIQVAEKSVQIEYHVNHAHANAETSQTFNYQSALNYSFNESCDEINRIKKWIIREALYHSQDTFLETPFSRPPPSYV